MPYTNNKRKRARTTRLYPGRRGPYLKRNTMARKSFVRAARTPRRNFKKKYGSRGATRKNATIDNAAWFGLGMPLRIKGQMKASLTSAGVETLANKFMFAFINCVDMNNDNRTVQGTVANEGLTHVVISTTAIARVRAPMYFDQIASLYLHYLIRRVGWIMTIVNLDGTLSEDITIAWKLMKSHDDTTNDIKDTTIVEKIRTTPGMNFMTLAPSTAARTGNPSKKTIKGFVNVFAMVPKRVYYTESGEATVGEKTFASTAAIIDTSAAIGPRFVFWAWKTLTEAHIDIDVLGISLDVTYDYTAYDRIVPTTS